MSNSSPNLPPDVGITSLSPNLPEPGDQRLRSRGEEERRLKAIKAHAKRSASKLPAELIEMVKFHQDPGEIAPDAQPSQLGKKIQEKATPKLIEYTCSKPGSVKIGKMHLQDGTVIEKVEAIGPSTTRLAISLQEFATFIKLGMAATREVKGWVVSLCVKVLAAGRVILGSGNKPEKPLPQVPPNDSDENVAVDDYSEWKEDSDR